MNKIKEFFAGKTVAYYIALGATVCGVIAFIAYLAGGTNEFAPNLLATVIISMAMGTALGIFSAAVTFKLCVLAQYVLYLYAFGSFIVANLTLISNIAYDVDGSTLPAAFFVIAIFSLLSVAGSLTAGIMIKYGRRGRKTQLIKDEVQI